MSRLPRLSGRELVLARQRAGVMVARVRGSHHHLEFFEEERLRRRIDWARVARVVARKLDMRHYADALLDLASPPGNRLKSLKGDLEGFHSIRVNDLPEPLMKVT